MTFRITSIAMLGLCCHFAHATEILDGEANSNPNAGAIAPVYEVRDRIDQAVFSTAYETLEALKRPNESHYGVSDDPKLRESMAKSDRNIAANYEEMFKECENFISFQGGLVSFLKVVIFLSIFFLAYKAAAFMYKGNVASALEILLGTGALVLAVYLLDELLAVLKGLV